MSRDRKNPGVQPRVSTKAAMDQRAKVDDMLAKHYMIGRSDVAAELRLRLYEKGNLNVKSSTTPIKVSDEMFARAEYIRQCLKADGIEIANSTLFSIGLEFSLMALEHEFKAQCQPRAQRMAEELIELSFLVHPDTKHKLRQALLTANQAPSVIPKRINKVRKAKRPDSATSAEIPSSSLLPE